jgi:signal transduction histidine kinase
MSDYFTFLRDAYFFKDLSDDELRKIEAYCKEDSFTPGEVIFRENAPAERFFIVLDGMVEVWKDYAAPRPDLLAVHGQGHLFGEMALIDDLPRSATVVAKTATRVLYLFRQEFDRILHENASVSMSILRSLSAMVRKSNESFVEDLRRQNRELETAYEEVKSTQQELLRAERYSNLGKFSSMILHDIRNPISIVKGYGEMLQLFSADSDKVREYAANVVREAERLNRIASELLDYSRGEIRLDMQIASIDQIFEQVAESFGESLASRHIELVVENSIHDPVVLDQERILRVLVNVADNARKAMRSGGTLTITAVREESLARIAVADTGEGMTEKTLERMFEPFYSSSEDGGTGLGMVIVKNVVEAHRGTLEVMSEQGRGTTVTITLPLRS